MEAKFEFKKTFTRSVHNKKMANIEYSANFLLPNIYDYSKLEHSDVSVQYMLHLLGGGSNNVSAPLAFSFSPMPIAMILYTESGMGRITTIGGSEYSVSEHEILLWNCNTAFALQSIVLPWNFKLFFISGQTLTSYLNICKAQKCNHFKLTRFSPVLYSLHSLTSVSNSPDVSELLFMHKNLTDILSVLCSACYPLQADQNQSITWYLVELKNFLDNHFDHEFSLKHFEEVLGVNRYRLCREFSAHYGMPPLQYLTCKRIDEAKKILLTTDLSIHEISSIIGYENVNHFINLFKKYVGATPGNFRQMALENQSVLRCPSPQTYPAT